MTPNYRYVYDINSGAILRTTDMMWDTLRALQEDEDLAAPKAEFGAQAVADCLVEIGEHQKEGRLLPDCPSSLVARFSDAEVQRKISGSQKQLALNVTEACNLRCGYCVYGGTFTQHRTHGQQDMSWSTARKAIDLYIESSRELDSPTISFYGGEPLLNFPLIEKAIEYAKNLRPTGLSFGLTTNGTLLTDAVVSRLEELEIRTLVSLDGPQELHDRLRKDVFGKGTFSRVMENLKRIKRNHPNFYKKGIAINAVYQDVAELQSVREFFAKNKLFDEVLIRSGPVSRSPQNPNPPSQPDALIAAWSKMAREFRGNVLEGRPNDSFLTSIYAIEMKRIHQRAQTPMTATLSAIGDCIPGVQRLFCKADGTLVICERVDEGFVIGDVENGIDLSKVRAFMDSRAASLTQTGCLACPAIRLCKSCYTNARAVSGQTIVTHEECDGVRTILEHMLSVYCSIGEENPEKLSCFD